MSVPCTVYCIYLQLKLRNILFFFSENCAREFFLESRAKSDRRTRKYEFHFSLDDFINVASFLIYNNVFLSRCVLKTQTFFVILKNITIFNATKLFTYSLALFILRRGNVKMEVSPWKRIKCFPLSFSFTLNCSTDSFSGIFYGMLDLEIRCVNLAKSGVIVSNWMFCIDSFY